jgi:hypothetical protein
MLCICVGIGRLGRPTDVRYLHNTSHLLSREGILGFQPPKPQLKYQWCIKGVTVGQATLSDRRSRSLDPILKLRLMTKFSTEFELHHSSKPPAWATVGDASHSFYSNHHHRGRPWAALVHKYTLKVEWKAKEGRNIIQVRIISSFAIIIMQIQL